MQKVYDAVLFNPQGLKTHQSELLPCHSQRAQAQRVVEVCRRFFNPENVDDPSNLRLNINTTISGASFIQNSQGEELVVVGPDGTFSEKIIYADTHECDEQGKGTPIFGTQNIAVTGDVQVCLDLLLCDRYDHEVIFTVCANVNIALDCAPLCLKTSSSSASPLHIMPRSCPGLRSSAIRLAKHGWLPTIWEET